MFKRPRPVRIVELTDLPRSAPNWAQPVLLYLTDGAFVLYETDPNRASEYEHGIATVELFRCRWATAGGPNDEALGNHPLRQFGLRHNTNQEIMDSPRTVEQLKLLHKDNVFDPDLHRGARHFIFALKEGMVECIAEGYRLVGIFDSFPQAYRHVAATATGS